jgi:hypothetical protein
MQLRAIPTERELKERLNRKIKKKRKLGLGIVLKSPQLHG